MGRSTVATITNEACEAVWEELGMIYLSPPNKGEWKRNAEDFNTMWNFPNCVGAVDGKHVTISCTAYSESLCYNYKGNYSIVHLASCDANSIFTTVNIGAYGSQSDGGVLWHSGFRQLLLSDNLDLPEDSYLHLACTKFPYFMVGDAAFPLKNCTYLNFCLTSVINLFLFCN